MPPPHYPYAKSYRIPYRGCTLDSLLELRFVLSIEQEYRFLREPVLIGYHPTTYLSTDYHREGTRIYTPDFLIRHRDSSVATLNEIKPDGFPPASLIAYQTVAQHFIARQGYDWSFKVLFAADILLTTDQEKRYRLIASKKRSFEDFYALSRLNESYNTQAYRYHQSVPAFSEEGWDRRAYAWWVRRGDKTHGNAWPM
jgi:hypothetical protein